MFELLQAHIADEVHEHSPSGEVIWHHAASVPVVTAFAPLATVVVVVLLVGVIGFAIHRFTATKPTTAMRSTSA